MSCKSKEIHSGLIVKNVYIAMFTGPYWYNLTQSFQIANVLMLLTCAMPIIMSDIVNAEKKGENTLNRWPTR